MNKEMIMDKSLGIGRRDNFKLTFRGEFFFYAILMRYMMKLYLVDETLFSWWNKYLRDFHFLIVTSKVIKIVNVYTNFNCSEYD